jgi:hypothetical protein
MKPRAPRSASCVVTIERQPWGTLITITTSNRAGSAAQPRHFSEITAATSAVSEFLKSFARQVGD